jgi:hypothetical protein
MFDAAYACGPGECVRHTRGSSDSFGVFSRALSLAFANTRRSVTRAESWTIVQSAVDAFTARHRLRTREVGVLINGDQRGAVVVAASNRVRRGRHGRAQASPAVPAVSSSSEPTESMPSESETPRPRPEEPSEDPPTAVPERVPEELADLHRVLAELEAKLATWAEGAAEACAGFVDPDGLLAIAGPDCLTDPGRGLQPWLADLESAARAGRLVDVAAGIRAWQARAARVSAAVDRLTAANSEPSRRRSELRGRLSGYLAMARKMKLVEDEALADLHARAFATLLHVPTDLHLAERLVAEYARELNARGDQGGTR